VFFGGVFPPNSVATLGVLTVVVKAWCSFKVAPLWRGAHFEVARANLSALWACRIALVVAQDSF
jgi:hypothetical protein